MATTRFAGDDDEDEQTSMGDEDDDDQTRMGDDQIFFLKGAPRSHPITAGIEPEDVVKHLRGCGFQGSTMFSQRILVTEPTKSEDKGVIFVGMLLPIIEVLTLCVCGSPDASKKAFYSRVQKLPHNNLMPGILIVMSKTGNFRVVKDEKRPRSIVLDCTVLQVTLGNLAENVMTCICLSTNNKGGLGSSEDEISE
ncbi:hypothetical protein QVD17_30569 [Tagetes erecta]|uniref:Uncharacterized protein n=1 Tax=Tagetes erecta TaxID=13708 RepID=A0AAD8NG40_TARER|nr:hypothetical protein QVD17_30569 [Tagetes erecta]